MKTGITLTLALLLPLATACVAQSGTSEDVNATEQDITATEAQPQGAAASPQTLQRVDVAHQFTTTTVIGGQDIQMSDDQDPTTSKKVNSTDPVPVPWDPAHVQKR